MLGIVPEETQPRRRKTVILFESWISVRLRNSPVPSFPPETKHSPPVTGLAWCGLWGLRASSDPSGSADGACSGGVTRMLKSGGAHPNCSTLDKGSPGQRKEQGVGLRQGEDEMPRSLSKPLCLLNIVTVQKSRCCLGLGGGEDISCDSDLGTAEGVKITLHTPLEHNVCRQMPVQDLGVW